VKLAWSVLWRLFVLLLLFSLVIAIASSAVPSLSDPRFLPWKPSIVWGAFASLLMLSLLVRPDGAIHLMWGKKLGLASADWRRISWSAALLFGMLAFLNIVFFLTASNDAWTIFRLSAPIAGLILLSLVVPRICSRNSST
jgi:intracellular septation protein